MKYIGVCLFVVLLFSSLNGFILYYVENISADTGPVDIQPLDIEDATISEINPSNQYPSSESLEIWHDPGISDMYALLKFPSNNITSIPVSAKVDYAQLELAISGSTANYDHLEAHQITGVWSENNVKWANKPTYDSNSLSTATLISAEAPLYRVVFDITPLVQGWISNSIDNNGILIKFSSSASGGDYFTVYSSDNTVSSSYNPRINLKYNCPPEWIGGDTFTLDEEGSLSISLLTDPIGHFIDKDGDSLTFSIIDSGSIDFGISIVGDEIKIFPKINVSGTDTITIRAYDGRAYTEKTITITINSLNDRSIAIINQVKGHSGNISVNFSLIDSDNDFLNLVFQFKGGLTTTWQEMTGIGNLTNIAPSENINYIWNSRNDLDMVEISDVQIRIIPYDSVQGIDDVSIPFLLDNKPPILFNFKPVGQINITNITMTFESNEPSFCRYGTQNLSYGKQPSGNKIEGDETKYHILQFPFPVNQGKNSINISAMDVYGNQMLYSNKIEFFVDSLPPIILKTGPVQNQNKLSVIIEAHTNEPSLVRWSYTEAGYNAMSGLNQFPGGYQLDHFLNITANLGHNVLYVSATDSFGNAMKNEAKIEFNVSIDFNPPEIISFGPNETQMKENVIIYVNTNELSFCRWDNTSKGYSQMNTQNSFKLLDGDKHHETTIVAKEGVNIFYVSCQDLKGNSMNSSVPIVFEVKMPRILEYYPGKSIDINVTTEIYIIFSTEMDDNSIQNSLITEPVINGTWRWANETHKTKIVLHYNERLEYSTNYTITIKNSAHDTYGNSLRISDNQNSFSWTFKTIRKPKDHSSDNWSIWILLLTIIVIVLVIFSIWFGTKDRRRIEKKHDDDHKQTIGQQELHEINSQRRQEELLKKLNIIKNRIQELSTSCVEGELKAKNAVDQLRKEINDQGISKEDMKKIIVYLEKQKDESELEIKRLENENKIALLKRENDKHNCFAAMWKNLQRDYERN